MTLYHKVREIWPHEYNLDDVRDWLENAEVRGLVKNGGNTGWWLTKQGSQAIDDALADPDFVTVLAPPVTEAVLARLGLLP